MTSRSRLSHWAFFIAAILGVASCAALPQDDDVKTFANAASVSSSAMQNALETNRMLAVGVSRERESLAYASGNPNYQLRLNDQDAALIVTADKQLAVLAALGAYARALSRAADRGVTAELAGAAKEMTSAAAGLAAAASPSAAPIVEPAFNLGGNLIGLGLKDRYARSIRNVIRQIDPAVQDLAARMPESLRTVALETRGLTERYETMRLETLASIKRDRRIDRLRLYKEYLVARSDVDGAFALQEKLEGLDEVFSGLAAAHKALATGEGDPGEQVQAFASVANDLAALIKAVNEARSSR